MQTRALIKMQSLLICAQQALEQSEVVPRGEAPPAPEHARMQSPGILEAMHNPGHRDSYSPEFISRE